MIKNIIILLMVISLNSCDQAKSNSSVSGEDGDVSNMIAPVKSMIGDTLTLTWYFFDWITGDYGGDGEMSFVLE
ncbi:MAG: hypothetical protein HOI55_04110 [Candidatus Marinimicrobia bacterium]|jgi:hypothetical protein|nr:hypothetical protein [Candidatus Neomarinimicrobiota bacterium]